MAWLRLDDISFSPGGMTLLGLLSMITMLWIMYFKRKQKALLTDPLPGPMPFDFFSFSKLLMGDLREQFHFVSGLSYILSLTTSIYQIQFGPIKRVNLVKANAAEVLLSSNKNLDKSREYRFLQPWLGTGLLTSSGKKWHSRRKLLTPAFHFKILEDFVVVFNKQSNTLVKRLHEKADGTSFDIFPFITLCTLDIICETAMGCCIHAQDNRDSDYVKALEKMTTLLYNRAHMPWQHPDFLFKLLGIKRKHQECLDILHGFTRDTIKQRRRVYEASKNCDNSVQDDEDDITFTGKKKKLLVFLDLLLEYSQDGKPLTNADIQEEVDTFMFEGHDTTTTGINWFLYFMGCYPQIQSKVHEELDSVFGDSDRPTTMADLRQLNYMERCIKESLRLYPSVPFIARETTEDVVIDNHKVPGGSTLQLITFRLHRDPEQFPNPEVFDPDRFLPENCKKRHPYAYVPFSAGPRNCIGQKFAMLEEKIIISSVMRNFRIESTTRREDLKIVADIILKPQDGNIIRLFPRVKG